MASASKTPNLNLPQWVGTEKPERTDFNAAFDAIDTTVASHLADAVTDVGGVHGLEYEEGTWTPMDASGSDLVFTHNTQARYVRIGRFVSCDLDITYPTTSNQNFVKITLPFEPLGGQTGIIGYTTYTAGGIRYYNKNLYTYGGLALKNIDLSGKRMTMSINFQIE